MFASMFSSLFTKSSVTNGDKPQQTTEMVTTIQDVECMLSELDETDGLARSGSKESISEAFELLSVADTQLEYPVNNCYDETKSEINSDEEILKEPVKDEIKKKDDSILKKINSLQCLFTWNLKSNKSNVLSQISNKYGEYNLDISSSEFSLERFIGNMIIGYELFHKGETENAQMKILEIGKWLEELDNGEDKFYLSINTGLYHIMKGTFIHMLYASMLIEECKWLLDDIVPFTQIDSKSKACVYAVHAAVLTEYGRNAHYYKKACDFANKASVLDPSCPYWFYIYALALTTQRRYANTYKSSPTEYEINAIQHAIMLSDGKNTVFNYHRVILDRDTTIRNYHDSINIKNKNVIENNLKANLTIVKMIKTIISMEPKDPLLIVGCARILMTLPIKARDFNLGKEYLKKAMQMAPKDVAVFSSIEKAITHYKQISNKTYEHKNTASKPFHPQFKNNNLNLKDELRYLVYKYKNGDDDPLPNLIHLLDKFNGHDKIKIMAQICSFSILFANNLRAGVEQFMLLLEEPIILNNILILQHFSSFGSKKFNLAELICNEIRLATNSSEISSGEMLYYFKALTKIMETFNLEIKDVDPLMKSKLIVDSSASSTPSNTANQSELNLSDNDSVVDQSENKTDKSGEPKNLKNPKPKLNKRKNMRKPSAKKSHSQTDFRSQSHQSNPYDIEQMKSRMSKFLNSSEALELSNHSSLKIKNIGELRTQEEIKLYSQMLYQHVSNDKGQHNTSSVGFNTFPYQNGENSNFSFQPYPVPNHYPPSLLSIKPQIDPRFLPSANKNQVNKKKSHNENK